MIYPIHYRRTPASVECSVYLILACYVAVVVAAVVVI